MRAVVTLLSRKPGYILVDFDEPLEKKDFCKIMLRETKGKRVSERQYEVFLGNCSCDVPNSMSVTTFVRYKAEAFCLELAFYQVFAYKKIELGEKTCDVTAFV